MCIENRAKFFGCSRTLRFAVNRFCVWSNLNSLWLVLDRWCSSIGLDVMGACFFFFSSLSLLALFCYFFYSSCGSIRPRAMVQAMRRAYIFPCCIVKSILPSSPRFFFVGYGTASDYYTLLAAFSSRFFLVSLSLSGLSRRSLFQI